MKIKLKVIFFILLFFILIGACKNTPKVHKINIYDYEFSLDEGGSYKLIETIPVTNNSKFLGYSIDKTGIATINNQKYKYSSLSLYTTSQPEDIHQKNNINEFEIFDLDQNIKKNYNLYNIYDLTEVPKTNNVKFYTYNINEQSYNLVHTQEINENQTIKPFAVNQVISQDGFERALPKGVYVKGEPTSPYISTYAISNFKAPYTVFDFNTPITEDISLYALYTNEVDKVKVVYHKFNGDVYKIEYYKKGNRGDVIKNPTASLNKQTLLSEIGTYTENVLGSPDKIYYFDGKEWCTSKSFKTAPKFIFGNTSTADTIDLYPVGVYSEELTSDITYNIEIYDYEFSNNSWILKDTLSIKRNNTFPGYKIENEGSHYIKGAELEYSSLSLYTTSQPTEYPDKEIVDSSSILSNTLQIKQNLKLYNLYSIKTNLELNVNYYTYDINSNSYKNAFTDSVYNEKKIQNIYKAEKVVSQDGFERALPKGVYVKEKPTSPYTESYTAFDFNTPITEDISLYALYTNEVDKVKVIYHKFNGDVYKTEYYKKGNRGDVIKNPTASVNKQTLLSEIGTYTEYVSGSPDKIYSFDGKEWCTSKNFKTATKFTFGKTSTADTIDLYPVGVYSEELTSDITYNIEIYDYVFSNNSWILEDTLSIKRNNTFPGYKIENEGNHYIKGAELEYSSLSLYTTSQPTEYPDKEKVDSSSILSNTLQIKQNLKLYNLYSIKTNLERNVNYYTYDVNSNSYKNTFTDSVYNDKKIQNIYKAEKVVSQDGFERALPKGVYVKGEPSSPYIESYTAFDFNTPITEDISLYALYTNEVDKVKVVYHKFNGDVYKTEYYKKGNRGDVIKNPTASVTKQTLISTFGLSRENYSGNPYYGYYFDGKEWCTSKNFKTATKFTFENTSTADTIDLYPVGEIVDSKKAITRTPKNASKWMSLLDSNTLITALTIPGTHNSAATVDPTGGFISSNSAKCQNLHISDLFKQGVRAVDLRLKYVKGKSDNLQIYHGVVDQKISFRECMNAMKNFLTSNPTEFIFVHIKSEECDDSDILSDLNKVLNEYKNYIYQSKGNLPTIVDDVRGKMIIMTRGFSASQGLPIYGWKDGEDNAKTFINSVKNSTGETVRVYLQDTYFLHDAVNKWKNHITYCLTKSENELKNTTFIFNYTSGYIKNWYGLPQISDVSNDVNPRLRSYSFKNNTGYGLLMTDYYSQNFGENIFKANKDVRVRY